MSIPCAASLTALLLLGTPTWGQQLLPDPGQRGPTGDPTFVPGPATGSARPDGALPALAGGSLVGSGTVAGDAFGGAVALSGDTLLVGARLADRPGAVDAGTATVFVRSGAQWIEQATLVAADPAAFDNLGAAVALDGDTAAVGAPADDASGIPNAGSVRVFVRSGGAWTEQARLEAPDAATSDAFGYALALQGDTLLVGAASDDTPAGHNAGSAWVFVRNGSSWTAQAQLFAPDGTEWDFFGYSAALDGDTALLGAPTDNLPAGDDAGSAWVFTRAGSSWTAQAQLTASDASEGDLFGQSVAISGDTVLVGASLDDHGAGSDAGSARVFVRTGPGWTEQAALSPADGAPDDFFGRSVALAGGRALVGAPQADTGGDDAGSATLFERDGSDWIETLSLSAAAPAAGDGFGAAVALAEDLALVGVPGDDTVGVGAGAACVSGLGLFLDLGDALAGVAGEPRLSGLGPLIAGSGGQLRLGQAAPAAASILYVATDDLPTPFKGGLLHPIPPVLNVLLLTDPAGGWLLNWTDWPAGLPSGFPFWMQVAVEDAAAIKGVALSNALQGVAP